MNYCGYYGRDSHAWSKAALSGRALDRDSNCDCGSMTWGELQEMVVASKAADGRLVREAIGCLGMARE